MILSGTVMVECWSSPVQIIEPAVERGCEPRPTTSCP